MDGRERQTILHNLTYLAPAYTVGYCTKNERSRLPLKRVTQTMDLDHCAVGADGLVQFMPYSTSNIGVTLKPGLGAVQVH